MKQIPLTKGMVALVDDADFESVNKFNWYAQKCDKGWYAARRKDGKIVLLHRELLGVSNRWTWVDHRNFNTLDCQRHNIRVSSVSQNCCHQRKCSRPASSKYKGVCFAPQLNQRNPWMAYISYAHKRRHLGYFPTEELAARAYDAAAKELHKEFAVLNFP